MQTSGETSSRVIPILMVSQLVSTLYSGTLAELFAADMSSYGDAMPGAACIAAVRVHIATDNSWIHTGSSFRARPPYPWPYDNFKSLRRAVGVLQILYSLQSLEH